MITAVSDKIAITAHLRPLETVEIRAIEMLPAELPPLVEIAGPGKTGEAKHHGAGRDQDFRRIQQGEIGRISGCPPDNT